MEKKYLFKPIVIYFFTNSFSCVKFQVHFKPDSELCIIHPMVQWSFAYQNARKGLWEEAARDRSRFQFRLRRLSDILKPILANEHRNKIYTERFQDNT